MSAFRAVISRTLPVGCKVWLKSKFGIHAVKSYSQEGEDMILRRLFETQGRGFYVDVGAHHPKRFSNSYFFYKRGWRGINIDAMPGSMARFEKVRPRDINIEIAVANELGERTYYYFNEPALNGFDVRLSQARHDELSPYRIVKTASVRTERLEKILDRHLVGGRHIDFLSIDVEGMDYEVLQSNNWSKYRPTVVLTEALSSDLQLVFQNEIVRFMQAQGYSAIAKTMNTIIFRISG